MKQWTVYALAGAMLTASAQAQTVVDGSGNDIPPALLKTALASVSEQSSDPLATQFRRLHLDDDRRVDLCGQVNAKNAFGGYVGFVTFNFSEATQTVVYYDLRGSEGAPNKRWAVTSGCGKAAGLNPDEIRQIKAELMTGKKS